MRILLDMYEKETFSWKYFMSDDYFKQFYETNNDKNDGITGKYLFFHEDPEILEEVAREEIENNGFEVAKRNTRLLGTSTEYVFCLYYVDDSRKMELAKKYQEKNGIKYRYWKSDEDAKKGKYSKEFLERIRTKNSE